MTREEIIEDFKERYKVVYRDLTKLALFYGHGAGAKIARGSGVSQPATGRFLRCSEKKVRSSTIELFENYLKRSPVDLSGIDCEEEFLVPKLDITIQLSRQHQPKSNRATPINIESLEAIQYRMDNIERMLSDIHGALLVGVGGV